MNDRRHLMPDSLKGRAHNVAHTQKNAWHSISFFFVAGGGGGFIFDARQPPTDIRRLNAYCVCALLPFNIFGVCGGVFTLIDVIFIYF